MREDIVGHRTDSLEYVLYLLLTKQASTYYESVVGPKEYIAVRYLNPVRYRAERGKSLETLLNTALPDGCSQDAITKYCEYVVDRYSKSERGNDDEDPSA